jgi:hypothetical protein
MAAHSPRSIPGEGIRVYAAGRAIDLPLAARSPVYSLRFYLFSLFFGPKVEFIIWIRRQTWPLDDVCAPCSRDVEQRGQPEKAESLGGADG